MSLNAVNNKVVQDSTMGSNNKAIIGLSLGLIANVALILGPKGANANIYNGEGYLSTDLSKTISFETPNTGPNFLEAISSNKNLKLLRYKLKDGDNLTEISKKYNINIQDILRLNPQIKDKNIIKTGEFLYILFDYKLIEGGENNSNAVETQELKIFEPTKIKQNITEKTPEKSNSVQSIKTTRSTVFTPQVINSIIRNEKQITVFYQYARHTHTKDFKKIQDSNLSVMEKNGKIINLFLIDCKIFGERIVIKQIEKLKFEKGINEKIVSIFKGIDCNVIPNQIIDLYSKVESSGGAYNDTFEKARNEKNSEKQNLIILEAVNEAVGPKSDTGPLHIRKGWLDNEIVRGASINGKYESDTDVLRKKVFMVFKTAIVNGYSQEKVNAVLAKIDVRFDIEQMSKVVLGSFARIHDRYTKMGGLTKLQVVKLCFVAYNRGEGNANIIARKIIAKDDSGLDGLEWKDTNKRMSFVKVASLENDLQKNLTLTAKADITKKIIVASNEVETITGTADTKIISLSDRVKYHTGKIINIDDRRKVEKKLEVNPIEELSRSEQRFIIKAEKGDESVKIRSMKIRNIITDLEKYKKAA